ncbi:MAG: glycosyltransferase [Gammaproteobacteria bacterium]|jgi:hypothetical protein|nr:glycosyltransferase [Gammaproteobacteria bacterium]
MRTVHIIGSRASGGAERFFLRLVGALRERDPETFAIVRSGSVLESVLASSDGDGGRSRATPMRNMFDPFAKVAIRRLVQELDAGLVQTYMGRGTRLTRLRGRVPHVARLGNYYKLAGYRHADAWVGNTRGICDYLIGGGFPAQRVHLIPNFVDPPPPTSDQRLAELRRQWKLPDDALLVAAAGRLVPIKGFDLLLEAAARVPAQIGGRPVWFVIAGDGPQRALLERRAPATVRLCGWLDDPDALYALADLVAFPCREAEPFGNVIFEAWSHGRAVVTTRCRGALESSQHDRNAWHVPCDNAQQLADAIAELLADAGRREALGNAGRERLALDFSRESVLDAYQSLYRSLA